MLMCDVCITIVAATYKMDSVHSTQAELVFFSFLSNATIHSVSEELCDSFEMILTW